MAYPDLVVHEANHWLWYLAQLSLGGSFIAPSLLALRLMLATGFLFLLIWSCRILAVSVDSAVFAGTYCLINLAQAGRILWARRHITFDPDREAIYLQYFGPNNHDGSQRKWQCSRVTWQELCVDSQVKTVRQGEVLARKGDRCNTLSFLLSGDISFQHQVVESASPLHIHGVQQRGVIDAVEFIHRETVRGAVWGIDAVARSDDVRVLVLQYSQIDRVSKAEMGIEPILASICGVQVTTMLFATEAERLHHLMQVAPCKDVNAPLQKGQSALTPAQTSIVDDSTELVRFRISEE